MVEFKYKSIDMFVKAFLLLVLIVRNFMDNTKKIFEMKDVTIHNDNVLSLYGEWETPDVIISDGGYGVSGFQGDAKEPSELKSWYEPHIQAWSKFAKSGTTLWFWNTEIGWATVHPILDQCGWEYISCNVWNKGLNHIAGNCNLPTLKHFPIVTEICVQYAKRPEFKVNEKNLTLKEWLRYEWERTGLSFYKANEACGLANAATRKYLTKCHLWYAPPGEHFERMVIYANEYGKEEGKPYFSLNSKYPITRQRYEKLFPKFDGKYGITNVWEHPPLHNGERIKIFGSQKCAHLNQKPLKLIKTIIEVSSKPCDVIWEPFGGLCTAGLASYITNRRALCAEIDKEIFGIAVKRFDSFTTDLLDYVFQNEVEHVTAD